MSNQTSVFAFFLCLSLLLFGSLFELRAQEAGPGEEADRDLLETADPWEELEAHLLEREEQIVSDLEEWEEQQERRREEEGEYFDEEVTKVERDFVLRRNALEMRRLDLEREFVVEERDLQSRRAEAFRDAEEAFHALEEEMKQFWVDRQRGEMDSTDWESDEPGESEDRVDGVDWPPGPNSVRLVVGSVDDQQVVLHLEIAESDPIVGWFVTVKFDSGALEFAKFDEGDFIAGFASPGAIPKGDGAIQIGGGALGGGNPSDGDGLLGIVVFNVTGEWRPQWPSVV